MAAYNARGDQIAELENVAEGGVRVRSFSLYNRNEKLIFRWTPFVLTSFGGVQDIDLKKVFELGDIPRPDHEIGNAYTYDAEARMIRETHPSGKFSDLSYEPWGTRTVTTYTDQFAGTVRTEEYSLSNENGVTAVIISDGNGRNDVSRFVRDSFGYINEIWLPGESTPRRLIHNLGRRCRISVLPGHG